MLIHRRARRSTQPLGSLTTAIETTWDELSFWAKWVIVNNAFCAVGSIAFILAGPPISAPTDAFFGFALLGANALLLGLFTFVELPRHAPMSKPLKRLVLLPLCVVAACALWLVVRPLVSVF
jgi:hypothetical protein